MSCMIITALQSQLSLFFPAPIMCALTPPLFPNFGWPLENLVVPDQNNWVHSDPFPYCNSIQPQPSESILHFPSPLPEFDLDVSRTSSEDPPSFKKLNHNASERDRRKKLNSMYSSLRSLLPDADQAKKLSIPATVSRVLRYIPELQKQVEGLRQRKEEMLLSICGQKQFSINFENQSKVPAQSSLPTVSASRVGEREVVIQICTSKLKKGSISEVLLSLEEEGLHVLNASVFASSEERVFYSLHLQVKENRRIECEVLIEKLLSMYERQEELFV